jgi:hypothetical protein
MHCCRDWLYIRRCISTNTTNDSIQKLGILNTLSDASKDMLRGPWRSDNVPESHFPISTMNQQANLSWILNVGAGKQDHTFCSDRNGPVWSGLEVKPDQTSCLYNNRSAGERWIHTFTRCFLLVLHRVWAL